MRQEDDQVAVRPRGRPIRQMPDGMAVAPRTRTKCGECPVYDRRKSWCPVKAMTTSVVAPACRWGVVKIRATMVAAGRAR